MKKAFIFILVLAIGGAVYFFQGGGGLNKVNYKKVVTYRLKDIFGFDFKAEKVELNELNELVITGLEVYGKDSGKLPMFYFQEIRGVYDVERLKLQNEIYVKKAKINGISIPFLEEGNAEAIKSKLQAKLNDNFRDVFSEWDNKEEIQKVLDEIINFYEKSKVSDLNLASRTFNKAKQLENIVKATNLSKRPEKKADLEEYLEEFNKGVQIYQNGSNPSIDYDPNVFLDKKKTSFMNKQIREIELIEFLFDKKFESLGQSIIGNLRELYKAQFFSPEAKENFPQLTFDKIDILEKISPDAQNVMVGFLSNVSSLSSGKDIDKIKILIQGDFEKYNIKGIDARFGIYKDDNKIITYNVKVKEVPLKNFIIYEDEKRALMAEEVKGFIALKGIVHKAEVRGDLTYLMSDLKFYRNPTLDNIIAKVFDIFEAKEKKQLIVIMDDKPGEKSFIEVEYGDEYLEGSAYSPELTEAYFSDIMNAYFRDVNVSEGIIKEKAQELDADYQKTMSVIELIKSKLNTSTQ